MSRARFEREPAGLYVHIPFCDAKCQYCGFYSEPIQNHDPIRLISAIIAELNQKRCQEPFSLQYNRLKQQKEPPVQNKRCQEPFFQTVYIGGGSPSCLPDEQLLRLVVEIASIRPETDEFTIEVNPGQVNKDILSKLRKCGVNRLSIGAQSFNAGELNFLGRRHTVADTGRAVGAAKEAGFENVGLDLIFAIPIPNSTLVSAKAGFRSVPEYSGRAVAGLNLWEKTLQSAIELDIQHISTYALTYEEGTPLQKAVAAGEIEPVDEEIDRRMYERTIDKLEKAGFKQYEISNFSRSGFECKHNLNYWANKPYLGVGPAAGSYWKGRRSLNIADIKKYVEAIEKCDDASAESESPNALQIACETAVLNLRRRSGIDLEDFKKRTGIDAIELFSEPIDRYKKLGLIEAADGRLFLTRTALPIADSVLCDFSDV
jgi:oxygen-independent coproporphyrinogen-3 oxidase